MLSINELRARRRITAISDAAVAQNASAKDYKDYIKNIAKSANIHQEMMGSADDFKNEVGSI